MARLLPRVALALLATGGLTAGDAPADQAVEKWAKAFDPSALSEAQRKAELQWFAEAAKDLRGLELKSIAEAIATHTYEAEELAKAFTEITGIKVVHNIMGEGELCEKLQQQIQTKQVVYHVYVNDGDWKGTHLRKQTAVNLSEYMKGEGKAFTNPDLDLDDFLNLEFGKDYDGNLNQLPDQQFPILYWFRYDLFTDPGLMAKFKETYKYELGVPVTWAAYEDIAQFFTEHVIEKDGKPLWVADAKAEAASGAKRIWGHLDYGKPGASLGWRFSDAWLGLAGTGDKGLPNGLPVDEWGIRVEKGVPVGSSVVRGGELDGPSSIYALEKYIDWIKKYAPPYATGIEWTEIGPKAGEGNIAQTIYYCGTFISFENYTKPGSPVCDDKGNPKWRLAPQPYGMYWEEGMKVGYQDAGAWTIPWNVTGKDRAAAWLWAQFCVSKTVSLKKFLVGKTPNRKSTVFSPYLTDERIKQYGGLVEFFRSPARKLFTDTGLNVPDYPLLQAEWYKAVSAAISGEKTPQQALIDLAKLQDEKMAKLDNLPKLAPKIAENKKAKEWFDAPGAPKPPKAKGERGEAKTIAYDELIKKWKEKELR